MRKMLTNGRFVLVLVVLTAAGVLRGAGAGGSESQRRSGAVLRGRSALAQAAAQSLAPRLDDRRLGRRARSRLDHPPRSATLGNNEKGLELKPPTGECCAGAPPVLEFDPDGNLVSHWGGPGEATSGRRPITASRSTTRATSGSAATALRTRRSSSSRAPASSCCRSASRARARDRTTRRDSRRTSAAATTRCRSAASRRSSSTPRPTRPIWPTAT